jgi:allophanate hydrolase subunit 1
MTAPRITFPGDACLSIEFAAEPGVIDEAINSRCVALATALGEALQSGVRDIVPGFYTVLVHFDPLRTERKTLEAAFSAQSCRARRMQMTSRCRWRSR